MLLVWDVAQLRAAVLSDLKSYVPDGHCAGLSVDSNDQIEQGRQDYMLGKSLFFEPPIQLTARLVAAVEVLMWMGMFTMAKTASELPAFGARNVVLPPTNQNALKMRRSLDAAHADITGNTESLEQSLREATRRYLLYLTENEAKPLHEVISDKSEATPPTAPNPSSQASQELAGTKTGGRKRGHVSPLTSLIQKTYLVLKNEVKDRAITPQEIILEIQDHDEEKIIQEITEGNTIHWIHPVTRADRKPLKFKTLQNKISKLRKNDPS